MARTPRDIAPPPEAIERMLDEYRRDPAYWLDILVRARTSQPWDVRRREEARENLRALGVDVRFCRPLGRRRRSRGRPRVRRR